tara:strand:- start:156 stop:440 length:285 start_codon:yes stop_codon:yes gene_type:complete
MILYDVSNVLDKILTFLYIRNKSIINHFIMRLAEIRDYLDAYMTRQEKLDYPDQEYTNFNELYDALEIIDGVVDYEPTDQQMMSSFGTKWHDHL